MSSGDTSKAFLFATVISLYFFRWGTQSKQKKANKKVKKKYEFLSEQSDFTNLLLVLIAQVVKIDKKQLNAEYRYVEQSFMRHFSAGETKRFMDKIKAHTLNEKLNIVPICRMIRTEFDDAAKVQLMHLLIGICAADGLMTKKEEKLLKGIAIEIRMPFSTFKQLLSMFYFKQEGFQERKRTQARSSAYQLKRAFEVLGLDENASVKMIKKTYRKLAMKHHPDRVLHLGESVQKSAKEKFQIISDAYELIKTAKDFA